MRGDHLMSPKEFSLGSARTELLVPSRLGERSVFSTGRLGNFHFDEILDFFFGPPIKHGVGIRGNPGTEGPLLVRSARSRGLISRVHWPVTIREPPCIDAVYVRKARRIRGGSTPIALQVRQGRLRHARSFSGRCLGEVCILARLAQSSSE